MKVLRYAVMSLGVAMMPAIAHAQACVGTPVGSGQFGLEAGMGIGDGFKSYGGALNANLPGPLTLSAGASTLRPNEGGESMNSLSVQGGFELLSVGSISACPVVGAGYSMANESIEDVEFDLSQITVPVGLGLGASLPAGNVGVTLYAVPQWVWYRTSISAAGESLSDSDNAIVLQSGIRLNFSSFYAGAGVALDNQDGSEPIYNFGIGFVIGGGSSGMATGKR